VTVTILIKELAKELRSQARAAVSVSRLRTRPPAARQLEIGSGPVRKPGWLTIDMCKGADVYWDLRRSLPFRDATFERVYCSHVLEHFSYLDLRRLLREVHRVLRPGGQFVISVPDASLYVQAYVSRGEPHDLLRYRPAVISDKPMDLLNYIFYMDNQHRFMFDAENLSHHCREAGFESCEPRAFDPTIDSAGRDYESLYMQCHKASLS
jgi:predicted SAM-dependent methyltransferase